MIKIAIDPHKKDWNALLKRKVIDSHQLKGVVSKIIADVQKYGDKALFEYATKFDKVKLSSLKVDTLSQENIDNTINIELIKALKVAASNITKFHSAQKRETISIETSPGVVCMQKYTPIEKVGLYIPGGTAPLVSTVLMLAIPARIAGCKEIVICTPPDQKTKKVPNEILAACAICDIKHVYTVGGAQAIAAMAYGTETIPKVHKIFGPGNQYVTMAKSFASLDNIAIDMPAGPSELCVWIDNTSVPSYVAADLLSQAEHGIDSQVIAVGTSKEVLEKTKVELLKQLSTLPRKHIAEKALKNSCFIKLKNTDDVVELINIYAAEHLIIATDNAEELSERICNAGSIFLGHHSPESIGDYASGTNHTLPTNGTAVSHSGITLDSFCKAISLQKVTKNGLQNIGPFVETLAHAERLYGHKNAVSIRLKDII